MSGEGTTTTEVAPGTVIGVADPPVPPYPYPAPITVVFTEVPTSTPVHDLPETGVGSVGLLAAGGLMIGAGLALIQINRRSVRRKGKK